MPTMTRPPRRDDLILEAKNKLIEACNWPESVAFRSIQLTAMDSRQRMDTVASIILACDRETCATIVYPASERAIREHLEKSRKNNDA